MTAPNMKAPDKFVAALIAVAAIGIPGYILYKALPFLIEMAANIIILGAELALIAVVVMGILSNWQSITHAWMNLSRKLRRTIVREDPIGILRNIQSKFERKLAEIDDARTEADAARKRLVNSIRTLTEKSHESGRLANTAQSSGRSQQPLCERC